MKKKVLLSLGLVLLLCGGYFTVSTLAKYITSLNGTGSATIAKWTFSADNATQDYDFDLTTTANETTLADGKIAPGTSGKIDVLLTNNSDVAVDVTVNVTAPEGENVPALKFYKDAEFTDEVDIDSESFAAKLSVGSTTTQTADLDLFWKWDYEVDADGNTADTAVGEAAATDAEVSFTVEITGTQINPTAGATTTSTAWE